MYLAAVLEKRGIPVSILDFLTIQRYSAIEKILQRSEADIYGITMTTANRFYTEMIVQTLRRSFPRSRIVVGGVHATFFFRQILQRLAVDAVFLGESEFSFARYVEEEAATGALRALPGIAWRDDSGGVVHTEPEWIPDIDTIPMPAFHRIDLSRYKDRLNQLDFHVITSRGCPFFCNFCSIPALYNGSYRVHSVARVLDELEYVARLKYRSRVMLHDDFFSVDSERTRELCAGIAKRKIAMNWATRSRVDAVDYKTLVLMRSSGCEEIFYGVETGSPELLKKMNKEFEIADVKRAFMLTKKSGIKAICNIIVGYPGENKKTLFETQRLLAQIKPDQVYFSPIKVLPGTSLYYQSIAEGFLDESFLYKKKSSIMYTKDMSYWSILTHIYWMRLSLEKGFIRKLIFIIRMFPKESRVKYQELRMFAKTIFQS